MSPERRTVSYVALIFVSGLLLGGTLMNLAEHYWLHAHPANEYDIREHQAVTKQLSGKLHLTPDQEIQVDAILQQAVRDYQSLETQLEPQFDAVRAHGRQQLRAVFTDQQRKAFDDIVRQVDLKYPTNERPASLDTPPCGQLSAVPHP